MAPDNYERIKQIIEFLDENQADQPSLEEIGHFAGLSVFHIQRLFASWVGVTPKTFLQCLTLNHAKKQLPDGGSVLDAALDAGLSGPGRLHDLCVSLEAASPGEIKTGGRGWCITAGFAPTPFGLAVLGESPRGICHFSFVDSTDRAAGARLVLADWPAAGLRWDDQFAKDRTAEFFDRAEGNSHRAPLHALVRGSDFQVRVWRALLRIPLGQTVNYAEVARAVDAPAASRAVGSAIGENRLAYLIPCHRVIRKTGAHGDYRWGSDRKRVMLAWETIQSTPLADR